jgi:hypothetical protein
MVKVEMLSDRKFSILAQICVSSLRLLLTIENLYIYEGRYPPFGLYGDTSRSTEWMDLLLPFTAVKNLFLPKISSPGIALALQEHGGRTTEVLPALQNILLGEFPPPEPVQKCIARFISVRQLTYPPVAISAWHRDSQWD